MQWWNAIMESSYHHRIIHMGLRFFIMQWWNAIMELFIYRLLVQGKCRKVNMLK
jgi:hypothetical protein